MISAPTPELLNLCYPARRIFTASRTLRRSFSSVPTGEKVPAGRMRGPLGATLDSACRLLTRPMSGKEAVSPPPPPLRTGHESFPSSGSSRFKAPLWTEPVHFHLLEHSSRRHVAMVVRPPSYHGVEPVYQVVLTNPPALADNLSPLLQERVSVFLGGLDE